jgi:hypothetical protein
MAAHLLTDDRLDETGEVLHLSGANYRGRHRSASHQATCQPGALVLEPGAGTPSSVIRLVDAARALVRHVGTCDDHVVAIDVLTPFADGRRVRIGCDYSRCA